ncbi:Hypothetical protein, putative [Bodo saltans]|uniref:Uncharacterized protein n=1 Tax=Bodo saltans TaxID=75058 RepID=A0A0S4JW27_BODSA|nr:Hypothetical protein, putative [Bodo saltans]|eukprot:CUG93334.1 Hypothetical protein, putative [Bodo saltans]
MSSYLSFIYVCFVEAHIEEHTKGLELRLRRMASVSRQSETSQYSVQYSSDPLGNSLLATSALGTSSSSLLTIDTNLTGELPQRIDSVRSPRLPHGADSIRFASNVIAGMKSKSPRPKRGVGMVDVSPSNRQQEITATEKKIEEAKSDLEAKLYLLRTQITRIEELERQVELGSIQLLASRRRREGETSDLESQRRLLQAQLERQLADNRTTASQIAATQVKNEGMNKGIRAQVVSLAETFSPRWAGQDVRNLIRATAETNDEDDPMTPEEEAEALRSVLDLRDPEQRLEDVIRWKKNKDGREREMARQKEHEANLARQAADDDRRAAEFETRMRQLQRQHPETPLLSATPTRPLSPKDKLFKRYQQSASHSIHNNAELTLHAVKDR